MGVSLKQPRLLNATDQVDGFDSGSELIDAWFHKYSLIAQSAGTAKTFVVCTSEGEIAGFYSIATGQINHAEATERVCKGVGQHSIPVIVLARLAVDLRFQGFGVGAGLLKDCAIRVGNIREQVGVRALVTHAKDEDAAKFYSRFGFVESPIAERQMMILMKDLRGLIRS
ncbi:GNAT family N-acetyltransferase [Candidatus Rhodoluna planktonica]|uniref:N-acetyltransferase domain-containing protein n=1 Tax=Candidatus Rhodoluna planktonica TaxID=535712 RepID=A0A1D9E0F3_9MICO|nr:GNAT family N-acetyltransferase [Candidatus Rhodoluna planktonica]AOY56543.1 hypothetical protein A4Z71_06255 [Candidatus Rhodoluna planktonica]